MSYSHDDNAMPHRVLVPTTYHNPGDIVYLLPHQVKADYHEPVGKPGWHHGAAGAGPAMNQWGQVDQAPSSASAPTPARGQVAKEPEMRASPVSQPPVTGQDIAERGLVIEPHEEIVHGNGESTHGDAEAAPAIRFNRWGQASTGTDRPEQEAQADAAGSEHHS